MSRGERSDAVRQATRSRRRTVPRTTIMNAWSALSAVAHCSYAPADLYITSCDADEEKERRRRYQADSGASVFIQATGGTLTTDWISEADVASRLATNTRVNDGYPIAFFCTSLLSTSAPQFRHSIDETTRRNILKPRQTGQYICLLSNVCRGCVTASVMKHVTRPDGASSAKLPVTLDNAGRLHGGLG